MKQTHSYMCRVPLPMTSLPIQNILNGLRYNFNEGEMRVEFF